MQVLIGIATCNDVKNIGSLLSSLSENALPPNWRIMVVSSSSNGTDDTVQSFMQTNHQISMIHEAYRRGKVDVLNRLLRIVDTEGYDALVFLGGDNLADMNSIKNLIRFLEESDHIGVVGGHPVPMLLNRSFVSLYYDLQWKIHHLICEKVKPKISGELMAIKAGVIHELPPAIINDDAYVEAVAEIKGYKTAYAPDSLVYLHPPQTMTDLITQRRRVYIGHHQMRMITNVKPSTLWFTSLKHILKTINSPKDMLVLILSILMQGSIYFLAKIDFLRGYLPYKWKIVESAKR